MYSKLQKSKNCIVVMLYLVLQMVCLSCFFYVALLHLNGIPLHGKQLHISVSKYSSVQMPKEGSNEVS